jgi:hypothetical protein
MRDRLISKTLVTALRRNSSPFVVAGLLLFGSPLGAQAAAARVGRVPLWGRVADAKIMQPDRLVVVDERDQRIWLVDGEGRQVATAGRRGQGPGEFMLTERLLRMDDSTLGVIDRRNARLTRVRVRRDTLFTIGSVSLSPYIEDACRLGDSLYLGFADVATTSQVSVARLDGTITGTLARVPVEGSPLFRETQLEAAVGCQATPPRIVTATRHTGVVTAWSLDGRVLWRTPLPAFRAVAVEPGEAGGVRHTWRRDGNSRVLRVLPLRGDTLLVAAMIFWVGPPADTASIIGSKYLLDARTGRMLFARDAAERVLEVVGDHEAVLTEEPEPLVRIRRR